MKKREWREINTDAKIGWMSRCWKVVVVAVVHGVRGAEEEKEKGSFTAQQRDVFLVGGSLCLAVEKILTACDLKGWGLVRLVPTFKRGGEAAE